MSADHPLGLRPGMQVGPWRIHRRLGAGAFGAVFQVEHAGQRHALKFALRGPGSEDLNQTDARAARELACLLQATHPNVVRVWAHGRWPDARTGYHYVVLDYVEGSTLATWVEHATPSARRVARLFSKLARTLGELHARTVFHRDLKPSNILVRSADEEPVLVDFGSADHAESLPLTEGPLPPGTPQYRSPEALRFRREHHAHPDARYPFRATDDLYALGVTLHEVLSGAPAYSLTLPRELLVEYIETRDPAPASSLNPRVPPALEAISRRLMHKDPEARFPDGASLHAALEQALRDATADWDVPLHAGASNLALTASLAPATTPETARRPSLPRRSARATWGLLGVTSLVGAVALIGWRAAGFHPEATSGATGAEFAVTEPPEHGVSGERASAVTESSEHGVSGEGAGAVIESSEHGVPAERAGAVTSHTSLDTHDAGRIGSRDLPDTAPLATGRLASRAIASTAPLATNAGRLASRAIASTAPLATNAGHLASRAIPATTPPDATTANAGRLASRDLHDLPAATPLVADTGLAASEPPGGAPTTDSAHPAHPPVPTTPPPMQEQTVKPSSTTPEHPRSPPSPRRLGDTLARCTVGMAAAASIQCASTSGAGPGPDERQRRGPCPPEIHERQARWFTYRDGWAGEKGLYYPYSAGLIQINSDMEDVMRRPELRARIEPGPITSRFIQGPGFSSDTLLKGWVYVDAAGVEIQYTEAEVVPDKPGAIIARRNRIEKGFTMPICARLGLQRRRRLTPVDDSVPPSEFVYKAVAELFIVHTW